MARAASNSNVAAGGMSGGGELKPSLFGNIGVSSIVVVALLLYLAAHGNIPFLMKAEEDGRSDVLAGIIAQAVFLLMIALLALPHLRKLRWAAQTAAPLLTLCGLAMLSSVWSQEPVLTLKRSIMLFAPTIFGLTLYVRYSTAQLLRLLVIVGGLAAVLSVALAVFAPEYGFDRTFAQPTWQGIFPQKNVCARACVFLMLPTVIMIGRKHSILALSVFALLALVLAKTHSTSGLIFAAVLVTILLICRLLPKLLHSEFFLFAVVGVGCCAVIALALNTHFDQITLLLGKDATLSGRTQIWQGAAQAIAKHPFLGYGFSAFWLGLQGESANIVLATRWLAPAAHNGFLDLCLQLGFAGLIPFSIALLRGCTSASYCLLHGGGEAAEWCAGIMLLTIIYNLDESSLMIPGELLWVLFTVAFITVRDLAAARRFAEQVYRQRFAIASPTPEFLTVTA